MQFNSCGIARFDVRFCTPEPCVVGIVLGYLQRLLHLQHVGNLLSWVTIPTGDRIPIDPTSFLPSPNLSEMAHQAVRKRWVSMFLRATPVGI